MPQHIFISYLLVTLPVSTFVLLLSILVTMAQTLLYLHASEPEEGEIPSIHWSGEVVDTRYVNFSLGTLWLHAPSPYFYLVSDP